jgi:hypothetical protein
MSTLSLVFIRSRRLFSTGFVCRTDAEWTYNSLILPSPRTYLYALLILLCGAGGSHITMITACVAHG